jgi:hypothetical protein
MTIATLDREMKEREVVPSGPCRIVPLFPRPSYSLPQSAWRLRLGFKIPLAGALPPLDLSPHATINPSILELAPNQTALFRVENGIGKELWCFDPSIAIISLVPFFFPSNPFAETIPITKSRQDFVVFTRSEGRTAIVVYPPSGSESWLIVIVVARVPVTFHFLKGAVGTHGVTTNRLPEGDPDKMLEIMNKIYRDNHAGLEFFKSGVNTGLEIPGLGVDEHGNVLPGVRVSKAAADSRDFQKIRPHFNSNSLFNVFFVGSFIEELDPSNPPAQLFAETSQPPNSDPPHRCCLCRDNRDGDPQRFDFWGETLAHEAGHALGESDDFNNTDSLMFRFRDRVTGTKIDVEMSGRMLASFKQWQRRPPFTIP